MEKASINYLKIVFGLAFGNILFSHRKKFYEVTINPILSEKGSAVTAKPLLTLVALPLE